MRTKYSIPVTLSVLILTGISLQAQSTFDKETYMQFLDENKTLTCNQLLENNPQAYVQEQIRKLSENLIHNRLATELLRQKHQKEITTSEM